LLIRPSSKPRRLRRRNRFQTSWQTAKFSIEKLHKIWECCLVGPHMHRCWLSGCRSSSHRISTRSSYCCSQRPSCLATEDGLNDWISGPLMWWDATGGSSRSAVGPVVRILRPVRRWRGATETHICASWFSAHICWIIFWAGANRDLAKLFCQNLFQNVFQLTYRMYSGTNNFTTSEYVMICILWGSYVRTRGIPGL
jgi:hypothetical protein